jgi:hypothetical protein
MTRVIYLRVGLLCFATLLCSHSLSAKTDGALVQPNVNSATLFNAVTSTLPQQALSIWSASNYTIDDDWNRHDDKDKDWDHTNNWGKDGDGDKDDHDHHRRRHEPAPEPSTLLSFAAAILIGGGVFYSRRLRRSK